MFKLKLEIITPTLLSYQPHSHRRYFCWTLYTSMSYFPKPVNTTLFGKKSLQINFCCFKPPPPACDNLLQ